jgi:hypothetical protein
MPGGWVDPVSFWDTRCLRLIRYLAKKNEEMSVTWGDSSKNEKMDVTSRRG